MKAAHYPFTEGARYARAAEASATIINWHSDPAKPLWMRYQAILFVILDAMAEADAELREDQMQPSLN